MKTSRLKTFVIRFFAWLAVIFSSIVALAILGLILGASLYFKNANLSRLGLVDLGLIILAFLVFLMGLGAYEFITSSVQNEEAIKEFKEEVEKLEEKLDQKDTKGPEVHNG